MNLKLYFRSLVESRNLSTGSLFSWSVNTKPVVQINREKSAAVFAQGVCSPPSCVRRRAFVKYNANRKKKCRPPALLAMSFVLRHKVKLLRQSKHSHSTWNFRSFYVFTLWMMPLRNIWLKYVKLESQDYRHVIFSSFLTQEITQGGALFDTPF